MSSHTRTYTHTVEGGASATNDSIPSDSTLNKCMVSGGTFGAITPAGIIPQDTGIKCHLQLDVVKNSAAAANSILNNTALAELIRSAAAEEENDAVNGVSTVKSVYIRVEFNN